VLALDGRQAADEHRERRRLYWQLAGAAIAVATTALLVWQTLLMRAQLEVQADDSYQARRADLYARLYDRQEDCLPDARTCPYAQFGASCEPRLLRCPLAASDRAREEALRALVALEQRRGTRVRLRQLEARNLALERVDLRGADLTGADFSFAVLEEVRFDHAALDLAVFHSALLCAEPDAFRGASMTGADLDGVISCPGQALPGLPAVALRCPNGSKGLGCTGEQLDGAAAFARRSASTGITLGQPQAAPPAPAP
jgi:hypothetical protein